MRNQHKLFKKNYSSAYGGDLLKTRKGRERGRPLSTRNSMHMVLRSTKAKGKLSFRRRGNSNKIAKILFKFSEKFGIKILNSAILGNHIHLHLKISNRMTYRPFVRAITAAIAMAVTGASRWRPMSEIVNGKFWDSRPFTRIIIGLRGYLNINRYIKINEIESCGYSREYARYMVNFDWPGLNSS